MPSKCRLAAKPDPTIPLRTFGLFGIPVSPLDGPARIVVPERSGHQGQPAASTPDDVLSGVLVYHLQMRSRRNGPRRRNMQLAVGTGMRLATWNCSMALHRKFD